MATVGCRLLLALLLLLLPAALCSDSGAELRPFDFDFRWTPAMPLPGDSVLFEATAPQSHAAGANYSYSYSWWRQLPGQGYRRLQGGRSLLLLANASWPQFDARYRLSVAGLNYSAGRRYVVHVIKFVSLQAQIRIRLLTPVAGNGTQVRCRFWGQPLLQSLQFLSPPAAGCKRLHFEAPEDQPFVDLVAACDSVPAGSYSCYGRNAVSARQLSCHLSGGERPQCTRPSLQLIGRRPASGAKAAGAPPLRLSPAVLCSLLAALLLLSLA